MYYIKRFLILILGLILFTSCDCIEGEGPTVSETRNVSNFDAIELEASANVFITKSDNFEIKIKGQQNILDILRTRLRGRTLVIEYDEACVMNSRSLEIFISMPEITEIQIDGSGEVESEDVFIMDDLYLGVSGSGSIELEIKSTRVEAEINGSGSVFLTGETDRFISSIRGSGDIKASRLKAGRAKVHIGGSGSTYIYALDDLDVGISGSGNVNYLGDPSINTKVNGSGNVRKIK
ncbi:MAG: DUF2807 domain-containing protein [Bacteroidetes bacterium]|nr:DUF2807 domain-containing protein [Bacteroidota bacterium]